MKYKEIDTENSADIIWLNSIILAVQLLTYKFHQPYFRDHQ